MSAAPSRLLSVTTPPGPDAFLLTGFSGAEGLSRLYRFELELLTERDAAAGALVGGPIAWAVHSPGRPSRHFHGVVRRFAAAGREVGAYRTYRAVVVPWVWALTRGAECRAYADRTLPEVVEEVFRQHGFSDYEFVLSRTYPRRDHRVQYRESPFGFLCRLLEEEGVFYFFRHAEDGCRLVFADDPAAYRDCEEDRPRYAPGVVGRDRIAGWEERCEVSPGAWTPIDDEPDRGFVGSAPPAQESIHEVFVGSGGCCSFTPGGKFVLQGRGGEGEGRGHVVVAVEHAASDTSFTPAGGGKSYANTFTCIPATATFRPRPAAPRPVVAGPRDGEPCVPERGRVAVRFLWGRERQADREACRVRVAGDGAETFRPRVGQEVHVDFLDGDPDRPVLVARQRLSEPAPDVAPPAANEVEPTVSPPPMIEVPDERIVEADEAGETAAIGEGDRTVLIEGGDDVLTITKGDRRIRLDLGKSVTEAAEAIELRVGPSVIRMEPSGITIQGMAVTVEGHAQAEVKGLMTRLGAEAVLTVQGGATVIG